MNDTRPLARVTAVEPIEGFRLRLTFTDGVVREVDLSGDLWGPMANRCKILSTSAGCA